ncbi:MAG TPA: tetraacyldisaccharide 4'-kinase, partial [candidate division Zixibacteria bacterium]|nr:tetraacyldisaccharide 4'-kinase [candidate division Zixibacteria bacterium]
MKWLLAPLSWAFATISFLRWKLYRAGVLRQKKASAPVISVGNIAMGGTGKTPCVIWLARRLTDADFSPVVLTRGYGRTHKGRTVLQGDALTARLAGDEPSLMAEKIPDVPIAVHPDRLGSAREVGVCEGRVFILDDGFQHLKLARDFDIVLLLAHDPFSGGRFFPLGGLRDGLWRLREADAIVVVGEGGIPPELRFLAPDVPVFTAVKSFTGVKTLAGKTVESRVLETSPVLAFAGIGSPESFAETVLATGAELRDSVWFRDHHRYTIADIREIERRAEECNADILVTTEKDAVRLAGITPRLETYVLSITMNINEQDNLLKLIIDRIKASKG